MGFLGGLFGGSSKSSTRLSSTSTNPFWEDWLSQMVTRGEYTHGDDKQVEKGQHGGLLGLMSGPAPSYPGQMYVPTTEQEQRYFDFVNNLAQNKTFSNLLSGEVPYEIGPEWAENYYEKGIRDPALREYEEVVLPQLRESYAGPGYWGSARARAETSAAGDLASELSARKSKLLYDEELARRSAIESAYSRVLPTTQFYTDEMQEAGALQRQIEQEKVLANLQRWLMGEEVGGSFNLAYNPGWNLALGLLGIQEQAIGTVTDREEGGGLLSGGLNALGKGAGMWAANKIFG